MKVSQILRAALFTGYLVIFACASDDGALPNAPVPFDLFTALSVSEFFVNAGDVVQLSWHSNGTSCTPSGDWPVDFEDNQAPIDEVSFPIHHTSIFHMTCHEEGEESITDTETVEVSGTGQPPVPPTPPPSTGGEVFFHSLNNQLDTRFFRANMNGTKVEISPPLIHHGGLLAVGGPRVYFASTAGTGLDLNLWRMDRDGQNPLQINVSGCGAFGNIRDIDVEGTTIAFVAEFRKNQLDPVLDICVGSESGGFHRLNHGDQVNSESLVLNDGWIYTTFVFSDEREQVVRLRVDGSSPTEAIGPVRPEDAEIQIEGILGGNLVVVALNLNTLTPAIDPQAFRMNLTTGTASELTQAGNVEDAVVCNGRIGITFGSASPLTPSTSIHWFTADGTPDGSADYGVPVIDPYCG